MAKKSKAQLFDTAPAASEDAAPVAPMSASADDVVLDKASAPLVGVKCMHDLDLEETIKRLESENSTLVATNNELQDKLAAYIEEVDSLKTSWTQHPTSISASPDCDSTLAADLAECKKEMFGLKEELKILQSANDDYTQRVSELTFENASLHAQLQNLAAQKDRTAPQKQFIQATDQPKSSGVPYTPNQYANNGYSDWN